MSAKALRRIEGPIDAACLLPYRPGELPSFLRLLDATSGSNLAHVAVLCVMPRATTYVVVTERDHLPLGAVLVVVPAHDELRAFGMACQVWQRNRWCPVAVVTTGTIESPILAALNQPGMQLVRVLRGGAESELALLREAIRTRLPPDTADVAGYLTVRCSTLVGAIYSRCVRTDISVAHMRRPCQRIGPWSPRDWRAFDQSVKLVASATSEHWSETFAADRIAVSAKTVSQWCRRYFGRSWRELIGLAAWEAVLEDGLRVGGYATE